MALNFSGKPSTDSTIEHGVYEGELLGITIYTAEDYNDKTKLDVNMTFKWDLGDDTHHYDSFVKVYVDQEGFPVLGGTRAKLYNRISALYGDRFDSKDPNLEWGFAISHDKYTSLLDLPMWSDYGKDTPDKDRVHVTSFTVSGKELLGGRAMIEFGNAEKPDGTKSTKTSIINANPMPKQRGARQVARPAGAPA